jgi:hypothetical protein
MANVDNPHGFVWAGSLLTGDQTPQTFKGTLASAQTIAAGDALIASSGVISIAASTSATILGVAFEAVTSAATATSTITFIPATPWNIFEAQCSGTFATTILYTDVDIEGTTGIMEVNEDATTEQVFQVIDYVKASNNAVGANTRVLGVFKKSAFLGFEAGE